MFEFLKEDFEEKYNFIINQINPQVTEKLNTFTTVVIGFVENILREIKPENINVYNKDNVLITRKEKIGFVNFYHSPEFLLFMKNNFGFDLKKFEDLKEERNRSGSHIEDLNIQIDIEEIRTYYMTLFEFLKAYYKYKKNIESEVDWDNDYFEKLLIKQKEKIVEIEKLVEVEKVVEKQLVDNDEIKSIKLNQEKLAKEVSNLKKLKMDFSSSDKSFINSDLANKLEIAYNCLKEKDFENAKIAFNNCKNIDISCFDAYLGNILAKNKVESTNELINKSKYALEEDYDYNQIFKFCTTSECEKIILINEKIKEHLDYLKYGKDYESAVNFIDSNPKLAFLNFEKVIFYKDSKKLQKHCIKNIVKQYEIFRTNIIKEIGTAEMQRDIIQSLEYLKQLQNRFDEDKQYFSKTNLNAFKLEITKITLKIKQDFIFYKKQAKKLLSLKKYEECLLLLSKLPTDAEINIIHKEILLRRAKQEQQQEIDKINNQIRNVVDEIEEMFRKKQYMEILYLINKLSSNIANNKTIKNLKNKTLKAILIELYKKRDYEGCLDIGSTIKNYRDTQIKTIVLKSKYNLAEAYLRNNNFCLALEMATKMSPSVELNQLEKKLQEVVDNLIKEDNLLDFVNAVKQSGFVFKKNVSCPLFKKLTKYFSLICKKEYELKNIETMQSGAKVFKNTIKELDENFAFVEIIKKELSFLNSHIMDIKKAQENLIEHCRELRTLIQKGNVNDLLQIKNEISFIFDQIGKDLHFDKIILDEFEFYTQTSNELISQDKENFLYELIEILNENIQNKNHKLYLSTFQDKINTLINAKNEELERKRIKNYWIENPEKKKILEYSISIKKENKLTQLKQYSNKHIKNIINSIKTNENSRSEDDFSLGFTIFSMLLGLISISIFVCIVIFIENLFWIPVVVSFCIFGLTGIYNVIYSISQIVKKICIIILFRKTIKNMVQSSLKEYFNNLNYLSIGELSAKLEQGQSLNCPNWIYDLLKSFYCIN